MLTASCDTCHKTISFGDYFAEMAVRCDECGQGWFHIPPMPGVAVPAPDLTEGGLTTPPDNAPTDERPPTAACVVDGVGGASPGFVPPTTTLPPPRPPPSPASFEERLKKATGWTPVTWTLVGVNGLVFAWMALLKGSVMGFSTHDLLSVGAAYAPRTFTGQWWRTVTSIFLHANLAHLAGNLVFLLLIGPIVERLLGPARFAVVYLSAGIGGALLAMGWFPATVAVGASAAVYGVYGAFLGCCLRGPRTVSWPFVARRFGSLFLFAAVSLLIGWLDVQSNWIPHMGGLLFGLGGGLLFGHVLQPAAARRKVLRVALGTVVLTAILGLTGWGMQQCAARPVALLNLYAAERDRERELTGRFSDALRRWQDGDASDADLKRELDAHLIPQWEELRARPRLKLPPALADLDQRRLSIRDVWAMARSSEALPEPRAKEKMTDKSYGEFYCLYFKLRADNWRALAEELGDKHAVPESALMDHLAIEMLRQGIDEMANEDNPLGRVLDLSRKQSRRAKRDGG